MYRLQDTPHVVLRHSQAQLLLGLPQGCVHHILVSGVRLATWETKHLGLLGPWRGGMAVVAEGQ